MNKKEIEARLLEMLEIMLAAYNQEDSIISLEYDEESQECTIKLKTHIDEEDDYVGFSGY